MAHVYSQTDREALQRGVPEQTTTGRATPPPTDSLGPHARSVVDLLKELRDETTLLMRQEFALAKAEVTEKGKTVAKNSVYMAIGGALAYAGLLFVLAAITWGVFIGLAAAELPFVIISWLAPLIVGIVVIAVGYGLIQKGMSTIKRQTPVPEKTATSLQENTQWLKHKLTT